jgi:hypothetical protein
VSARGNALLVSSEYPPYSARPEVAHRAALRAEELTREGWAVEVIACSNDREEFVHLDRAGRLVHRVAPERSYLLRPLAPLASGRGARLAFRPALFRARAVERAVELALIWGRHFERAESFSGRGNRLLGALPLRRTTLETGDPDASAAFAAEPVRSADVILCTYRRLEELRVSVANALAALEVARGMGANGTLTLVYQDQDLPERLLAACPEWREEPYLRMVFSSPPSLTLARNLGVQVTQGDLAIFIDDDVAFEPSFVTSHIAAANSSPTAWGVAGRVRSQRDGLLASGSREVGQIRSSGNVESHFESIRDQVPIVPQTALGANMSYKRRPMEAAFGQDWFDESLEGSAFREETTLGLAILRHGGHLIFGPDAVLTHFQSEVGGCDNRADKTLAQQAAHSTLEYRFLAHLYELNPLLRLLAPWQLAARDTLGAKTLPAAAQRALANVKGYLSSLRG